MSPLAEDFAFLRGLAAGVIGLVVWIGANSLQWFVVRIGSTESALLLALIYLGAAITFGGPLWYWLIKPAIGRIRRG